MANTTITPTSGALTYTGASTAGVGFYSQGSFGYATQSGRRPGFRSEGTLDEQLIHSGPCRLYGIYPELTTTGTLTFRDGSTPGVNPPRHVCALGLLQSGKSFGHGIDFQKGLSIQQSIATDITLVSWEAL